MIAISAVITWLIYHYHVKLLSKILYRGQLEKEAILSNQFHEIRGENIFFSPSEINMIRDIYDFGAYDSLTRASVRRIFDSDINDLSENFGFLCLFDVDKFKVINDKFGHLFGDEVLIKLVGLIKEQLPCDKGDVYRFGGDEFAIIYRDNDLNALLHMLSHIVRFRMGA